MELKPEKWINIIKNSVFPGRGASTTKIAYMWIGIGGAISSFLLTLGMLFVYIKWRTCDPVYSGFCSGLWIALFAFATKAQNHKASIDSAAKYDAGTEKLD